MLIGNPNRRSTIGFLSRAVTRVAISPPVRDGAFHFKVDCRPSDRLCALLATLPGEVYTRVPEECSVRVRSSDVIRFKEAIRNPIRAAARGDEYRIRLVAYLLLEVTERFQEYGEDLYSHIHDGYVHDMRAGGGKFRQCINYIRGEYPGRLPNEPSMGLYTQLCFPSPTLLREHFYFSDEEWCYVLKLKKCAPEASLLFEAASMRLRRLDCGAATPNNGYATECLRRFLASVTHGIKNPAENGGEIKIPCEDFFIIVQEITGDSPVKSYIEHQLYLRQEKCIAHGLQESFNHAWSRHARDKDVGVRGNAVAEMREAILGLKQVQFLLGDPSFFQRLNPMGVLQAQQYFRGMNAIVGAMIACMQANEGLWTEEALLFFLKETCGNITGDIGRLLAIHDFFSVGHTIYRDAVVKFTREEVSEISEHINCWVSLFREMGRTFVDGRYGTLENMVRNYGSVTSDFHSGGNASDMGPSLSPDTLSQLFSSFRSGLLEVNTDFRNELLLRHLKSHRLCDFLCEFEYTNIHGKCDELLEEIFDNGCTNDRALALLRQIVKSCGCERIKNIGYSRSLSFAQCAYKISYWLPFRSFWLPWVNPANYRTSSGYVGRGTTHRFYAKNMMIPFTEFSQAICRGLHLEDLEHRFVESDYEAEMLGRSFRIEHNIPGFLERITFPIRKHRWVWYLVLSLLMVLCSVVAVVGQVLDHFGIIPGVLVKGALDVFRSIFDVTVAIVGLDTIVERFMLLVVSIAGLTVRVLDFILLCGLLSAVTRFIFGKFHNACNFLFEALISACEHARLYGLKDAFWLLIEKLLHREQDVNVPDVPTNNSLRQACCCDGTGAIQVTGLQAPSEIPPTERWDIPNALRSLSGAVGEELYGRKPDVRLVLHKFHKTLDLPQRTVFEGAYLELRKEFFFLLNNYQEELSIAADGRSGSVNILNSYAARREVYNKVTAANLQTIQLICLRQDAPTVRIIRSNEDAWAVVNAARDHGESITLKELNEKIAALRWALSAMDSYDLTGIAMRHETVVSDTKIEKSCAIALMDCVITLRGWKKALLDHESVSRDLVLCDLQSNFSSYIRDVCCILGVADRAVAGRHNTASYRRFCKIVGVDFLLLETPSLAAESMSSFVGLSLGARSYFSELKRGLEDFAGHCRELKYMLASLMVYQITLLSGVEDLRSLFDHYSRFAESAMRPLGIEAAYDFFARTRYTEQFLSFFWRSVFLWDVVIISEEFFRAMLPLGPSEMFAVFRTADHRIYLESFFRRNCALDEVKSALNSLGDLVYTVLQVHQVRAILRRAKAANRTNGNLEHFMQREEMLSTTNCNGEHVQQRLGREGSASAHDSRKISALLQSTEVVHVPRETLRCL
ncbi:hypothetical protein ACIS_00512 [Anaplasma centrale str. Israel]|uniref:Uncharacterized protein n=1 Tax=Anaplasma centrale (strain Israel) TaxID=574556 RepID=D1AUA2_ANACI|nr:hypothetical protein [Anaplasma centrale]ACZ49130.1 hypothetical protein ACIS_00512 [Anaplasma centrale str. Israel]